MQSKTKSLVESMVNTFSGFIISLVTAYLVLPFYGMESNINHSFQITIIFTLISISRNYIVRRFFN